MSQFILLWFSAIAGILLYSGVKVSSINDRTPESVSIGSILKTYFRRDFARIFISILFSTLVLFGVCNWLDIKEAGGHLDIPNVSGNTEAIIVTFIHLFVACIGYVSGSVVMAFGSKAEKYIVAKTTLDEKVKDVLGTENPIEQPDGTAK